MVLNRPEKRNAMSQELLRALADALREATADESVHCVVLRGEGPVFSAGVDLGELMASAGQPGTLRPFRNMFLECPNLCEAMPKPVICQIHQHLRGRRAGGGAGLRPADRLRRAQLGLPEVKFGIIPDVGGSTRLPAVVGLGRAKELIMTGAHDRRGRGRAHRSGQPRGRGRGAGAGAQALVDELLANSPVAVGRAKRVIDASARPALATTLEMEVAVQEYCVAAMRERAREAERQASGAMPAATA